MKIICLIDNTVVDDKLFYEDGFSLFVEYNGKNYLIDTGLTEKAVANAKRMRLPIDEVSAIVLTHNHSSHTGAVDDIMRLNPKAEIYLRAGAKTEVVRKTGLFRNPVGEGRAFFKKYAENLILFNSFSEVCDGFYLASCEDFDERGINPDRNYLTHEAGEKKLVPFDFSDESFAVIFPKKHKSEGLVLVGGCFHCGVVNMLETVRRRWYGIPILAVVGGFHFSPNNPKVLDCPVSYVSASARALKLSGAQKIYTNHCTGYRGFDIMDEILGDKLMYLCGGEALEF